VHLAENIFINLDELENLSRRNSSSLKEIITKSSIKLRRPYATVSEYMPRRASFMGSVNSREFLKDSTGNRRFLCFETVRINYRHDIDMDKVYGQAYSLYNTSFEYWFEGDDIKAINDHNENYSVVSLERELLENLFEPCLGNEVPDLSLETESLLEYIYKKSPIASRLSPKLLGQALTKMNWSKKKTMGRRYWELKLKSKSRV